MKNMRELIVLLFILIFSANQAFAYDLILPREKKSIVNTNYAFFVGKAKKTEIITINDERIHIASNGAFAHSVKLKEGENRVVMRSNFNTQVYKFYKNKQSQSIKPELIEFEQKYFVVKNDNTPLRSTPIDFGMNRISHLFKDTNLIINGSKGDFYRVFLSKNKTAWIAKKDVEEVCEPTEKPNFITMNSETFKNASNHIIEFTDKLPYTIDESEKEIIFRVYNPYASDDSVYTVNIRKPEKYTYKTFLCNGVYEFKVKSLPMAENKTLDGLTIVVDAGHGGSEKGAVGCLGDNEKDINLKIALELKEILSLMGAKVIMTRECDGNMSLNERVDIARENCTDIFVSIHLNSIGDIPMNIHKNRGTSVYYYNPNSKELAKFVEASLTNIAGTRKDGVRTASFAVIRPTDYVGILVETAYMTNPLDSVLYKSEDFSYNAAKGIAEGILNYVTNNRQ